MIGVTIAVLTVVEVIVAFLLIGVILIQETKSQGGIGLAGGAMTETVLGASAGNVLTKVTVALASLFLGITLVLAILTGHRQPGRSVIEGVAAPAAIAPTASANDEATTTTALPAADQAAEAVTPPAESAAPAAATVAAPGGTPAAGAEATKPAADIQPQKTAAQGEGAEPQP
jgi:preprotein translocase subunit SecG